MVRLAISAGWILLLTISLGIIYTVMAIATVALIPEPISATILLNCVVITAVVLVRVLKPGWLAHRPEPRHLADGRGSGRRHGLVIVAVTILVFAAGQTASIMMYQIQGSEGFDQNVDSRAEASAWLVLLLAVVVAPVAEELLLRGALYPALRKHAGVIASTLVTSVVFAVMHGNIVQGIAVMPLGVLLALMVEHYRSPWPGVAVHVGYNVTALVTPPAFVYAIASPLLVVPLALVCVVSLVFLAARLGRPEPLALGLAEARAQD